MISFLLEICLFAVFCRSLLAVELTKRVTQQVESSEVECPGTASGFGYSGDKPFHYDALQRRLKGCTYIMGNLEITHLDDSNVTYDLSFLSDIRVVTGYVLIAMVYVETIPLTSLELILGEQTFPILKKDYSLIVALNGLPEDEDGVEGLRGLRELQIPKLEEISNGRIMFFKNPQLCHAQSINWKVLKPDNRMAVDYLGEAHAAVKKLSTCPSCHENCDRDGESRCWGSDRTMCQKLDDFPKCHEACPGRCYDDHMLGCCHTHCAVGCFGPLDSECMICKFLKYTDISGRTRCIASCPPGTYAKGQDCIYNPFYYRLHNKR